MTVFLPGILSSPEFFKILIMHALILIDCCSESLLLKLYSEPGIANEKKREFLGGSGKV